MGRIDEALGEFQRLDEGAREGAGSFQLHPAVRLLVTVYDIVLIVSFHRYDLSGLLGMLLYPLILFNAGGVSFKNVMHRLRIVLPLVCFVGIFNPFFDRRVLFYFGNIGISGGMVSMTTLMIKGILTVLASYLLIAAVPMEQICYALRCFHVPRILVTELLLIYRYLALLLEEAGRVTRAYSLRAPGQKGVAIRAWGPLLGQMLLRSVDRAGRLYESMLLRGFKGEFQMGRPGVQRLQGRDLLYLAGWGLFLTFIRLVPVMELVGAGLSGLL